MTRIFSIVCASFDEDLVVLNETNASDIDEWDSLTQIFPAWSPRRLKPVLNCRFYRMLQYDQNWHELPDELFFLEILFFQVISGWQCLNLCLVMLTLFT